MAFEGTVIRSTRNGSSAVDGAREDLVAGDLVALSLFNTPQPPSTYEWSVIGRPEGSSVGGGGTNPWFLGASASVSFLVDADPTTVDVALDGTYTVQCVVNKGSSMETRFSAVLRRTTGIELPPLVAGGANRKLSKPGMFESLEDLISISGVVAGWSTMVTRWFEWVRLVQGKGIDVASAQNLLLNPAVGFTRVTGTTQIDWFRVTGRRPGSRFAILFAGALTLRHNIGSAPAGSVSLNLPGAANLAVTANSVRNFVYDGTVVHEAGGKAG